jgi:hypothetical protein
MAIYRSWKMQNFSVFTSESYSRHSNYNYNLTRRQLQTSTCSNNQTVMQYTQLMTYWSTLTFGSNLNEAAVRNAARPSLRTTANPPTRGEYSISTTYVLDSRIGIAANHTVRLRNNTNCIQYWSLSWNVMIKWLDLASNSGSTIKLVTQTEPPVLIYL